MGDELDEQAAAQGAKWADSALSTYWREMGVVPDYVAAARAAVRQHEADSGFEGDLEIHTWQLLLSIDDLRVRDGREWKDVFGSGDASGQLDVRNLVRGLHGLCDAEGIVFGEQLRTIWDDIDTLRPGRGDSWPDLSPVSAPSP